MLRDPGGQTVALRFDPAETSAKDRAFLAISEQGGYVKVLLPIRPNGTVGWIRSSDVVLEPAAFRVVIDLQAHALTVEENGKVLLRQQVATGTGSNPTPQGLFYIVDRLPQANPGGGLGPFAFKLSGFSETLYSFAGGQGAIGLHGTNAPGQLGANVSHGCIRIDNASIARLAATLPIGTPVEIVRTLADRPAGTAAGTAFPPRPLTTVPTSPSPSSAGSSPVPLPAAAPAPTTAAPGAASDGPKGPAVKRVRRATPAAGATPPAAGGESKGD